MSVTKNLKKIAVIAAMAALVGCSDSEPVASSAAVDAPAAIRVGSSGTYKPFTFYENDELKGFEIDVWTEVAQRLDRDVDFVTAKFSGLFGMLETNKLDTISNQITVTDARLQKYNFAEAYVFDGAQIAVKADNQEINSLADLKGKKVAVDLGSNFEEILRKYDVDNEILITPYDGAAGFINDVAMGRIDAFVMDRMSIIELIKSSGLALRLAGEPIEVMQNAMPFLKTPAGDALRTQVNEAIKAMRADGTLSKISERWFGLDITSKS